MRIVSLLPAATEIVWALGLEDDLVGVSHACDFPPAVVGRPVATLPSGAVDGARHRGSLRPADLVFAGADRAIGTSVPTPRSSSWIPPAWRGSSTRSPPSAP